MVREFYSTLKEEEEESFSVKLKEVEYLVTMDRMVEAYGIPNLGSRAAKKNDVVGVKEYNELAFKQEVLENPKPRENENIKSS